MSNGKLGRLGMYFITAKTHRKEALSVAGGLLNIQLGKTEGFIDSQRFLCLFWLLQWIELKNNSNSLIPVFIAPFTLQNIFGTVQIKAVSKVKAAV